jgi:hypothetical protein
MADPAAPSTEAPKDTQRTNNEVALEMMKFIAVTTGYGKGATSAAGFSGKPMQTAEGYAESLLQLFQRCRDVVSK